MGIITYTENKGVIVVRLSGDMNISTLDNAESILSSLLTKQPVVIALDCGELNSIDSTIVSIFVKFLSKAKAGNVKLIFFDLRQTIKHTFDVMQLNRFFTIISRKRFEEEYGNGAPR